MKKKKPLQSAISELQELILAEYPDATFEVFEGDDPRGTYLRVMIDLDEIYDFIDVFIHRLTDFQVLDGLELFVEVSDPRELPRPAAVANL